MERPLIGQAALVTGGAKRLGRAIALVLARAGADVVVHCRSSLAEAQSLVGELSCAPWAGRPGLPKPN
jgi:NAD(P)-dependent dehydrogenase (short-subunit alcohol dehydrogenase family)